MTKFLSVVAALAAVTLVAQNAEARRRCGNCNQYPYNQGQPQYQQQPYSQPQPYAQPYAQPSTQQPCHPCQQQQQYQEPYAEEQPPPPPPRHRHHHYSVFAPGHASITVGGAVSDFVYSNMRNATHIGAGWDARLTLGTRSFLALELAYVGAYNEINVNAHGGNSPAIVQHGFDSDLRFNFLPFRVQPYIFGGVGYNHMALYNGGELTNTIFRRSDDLLTVPLGGGLSTYIGHLVLDARFTYRFAFFEDFLVNGGKQDTWQVSGRVGFTF